MKNPESQTMPMPFCFQDNTVIRDIWVRIIAECNNDKDAAYIVKAVNCHEELVEALAWCVHYIKIAQEHLGIERSAIYDDAVAALAKAGA